MRTWSLFLIAAALGLMSAQAASAQAPVRHRETSSSPTETVRSWYARFLGREPDRVGLRSWSDALRQGADPRDVLAKILGGGEYYWRAGSTSEGFVNTLWLDLTGTEITDDVAHELHQLVRDRGREHAARAMLDQSHPGEGSAEAPDGDAANAEWRSQVEREAERLNNALEQLEEDVVIELAGGEERQLYRDIEGYLAQLDRFLRMTRSRASVERLQNEFRDIDERLHALVTVVRGLGAEHGSLLLRAQQVLRADRRMHAAVYNGTTRDDDRQRLMNRQAAQVAEELHDLRRTTVYALADARGSEALVARLDELCASADHFVQSAQAEADRRHLRADLSPLSEGWQMCVDLINNLPPRGHFYLRRQAQRVDTALDRLEGMLEVEVDRPRVYLP